MNKMERIQIIKAMEFIARCVNDENLIDEWLTEGVADGDIQFGDLTVKVSDSDDLEYYIEDETFADLMDVFLFIMSKAYTDGGIYCDGVVSKPDHVD